MNAAVARLTGTRRRAGLVCLVAVSVVAAVLVLVPVRAEAGPAGSSTWRNPKFSCGDVTVRVNPGDAKKFFVMYVPIGSKLTVSFKGHPVNGLNTPWLDTAWNPTTGLPNPEGQGYSRNAGFHAPENGDFEDSATVLNNASGSQNRWVMVGALPSNTVHAGEWLDVRGCRESFPSASVRRWLGEAPE